MPSIKLAGVKAKETRSGFEAYDGPTPTRPGMYRAKLRLLKYKTFSSKNKGFWAIFDLEAAKGDPKGHAIFDGYTVFDQSIVVEMADGSPLKDGSQRKLENFLAAIGAGDNPSIVFEKGDLEAGVNITKVGKVKVGGEGYKPIYVNLDCNTDTYQGDSRIKVNNVFAYDPTKAVGGQAVDEEPDEDEDDDDIVEDDSEDEEGGEDERAERESELSAMKLPDLRRLAKSDYELDGKGSKDEVIAAILEYEFETALDEDEDEEEEEDAEEDEEESDEDEEEEIDEDARREELADMDRAELKSTLKGIVPDAKVTTKMTDEDIIDRIIAAETVPF